MSFILLYTTHKQEKQRINSALCNIDYMLIVSLKNIFWRYTNI